MRTLAPAVAGLAAATLVLIPTTASAERWSHQDAIGDVVKFTDDNPEANDGQMAPAPNNTATDVRRVVVTHGSNKLRVAVKVRDIVGGGKTAVFRIKTSDRRTYEAARFMGHGFSYFGLNRANGEPAKCSGDSITIDKDTDVATLTLPRECVGNPRWVKVGAGYATFAANEQFSRQYADDALRVGMSEKNNPDLRMSPRISRS